MRYIQPLHAIDITVGKLKGNILFDTQESCYFQTREWALRHGNEGCDIHQFGNSLAFWLATQFMAGFVCQHQTNCPFVDIMSLIGISDWAGLVKSALLWVLLPNRFEGNGISWWIRVMTVSDWIQFKWFCMLPNACHFSCLLSCPWNWNPWMLNMLKQKQGLAATNEDFLPFFHSHNVSETILFQDKCPRANRPENSIGAWQIHFPILTKVAAHYFHSRLAPFSTFVLKWSAYSNDEQSSLIILVWHEWDFRTNWSMATGRHWKMRTG